ncbi:MAG: ATPase domain-containing protein [Candidatus Altiarchaeota archaeon]
MDSESEIYERVPTGIKGFDKLVEGGLPRGRTILVAGETGTGKTLFGVEFLCRGASEYNENGILLALEQSPSEIKKDIKAFNLDMDSLEREKKIVVIDASLSKIELGDFMAKKKDGSFQVLPGETQPSKIFDIIVETAKKVNAKRVVIDSLPALDLMMENATQVRRMLLYVNFKLKAAGLTTIMISELSPYRESMTMGIESYVVDGVIQLHYTMSGEAAGRSLTIKKMRGTDHSENIHPIKFVRGSGFEVLEL